MKSMYASRSVPVLNTPAPNAASVVDCSSQGEELQRKADMANGAVQRVVQRETGVVQREGEANGKFMYVNDLTDNSILRANQNIRQNQGRNADMVNDQFYEKLPYMEGCICFSDYQKGLQSPGFTGCMMMAFHFNLNEENKINDVKRLFKGGILPFYIDSQKSVDVSEKKFIAHVFCGAGEKDTKNALFDAEQRNLITIEALFKPWTDDDSKIVENAAGEIIKKNHWQEEQKGGLTTASAFIGRLTKYGENGWIGDVFIPSEIKTLIPVNPQKTTLKKEEKVNMYEKIKKDYPQRDDDSKRLKYFNPNDLVFETYATKAFVYASVIARKDKGNNINVTAKDNDVKTNAKTLDSDAWNYLEDIASVDKKIIQRAVSLANDNSKEKMILETFLLDT